MNHNFYVSDSAFVMEIIKVDELHSYQMQVMPKYIKQFKIINVIDMPELGLNILHSHQSSSFIAKCNDNKFIFGITSNYNGE